MLTNNLCQGCVRPSGTPQHPHRATAVHTAVRPRGLKWNSLIEAFLRNPVCAPSWETTGTAPGKYRWQLLLQRWASSPPHPPAEQAGMFMHTPHIQWGVLSKVFPVSHVPVRTDSFLKRLQTQHKVWLKTKQNYIHVYLCFVFVFFY